MTYNDLTAVIKYDVDGNLQGNYNYIFIQKNCRNISDDFLETFYRDEDYYSGLLADFAAYETGIINPGYKSGSRNGKTFYHVSSGRRGCGSLSEFFRLYAFEVDRTTGNIKDPNAEMYTIETISNSPRKGTLITLRNDRETMEDVAASLDSFQCNGKLYRAIMEIVGVGSHVGKRNDTYRLEVRNEELIPDKEFSL